MAAHTTPTQFPRRFIKRTEVEKLTTLSTSEIYRRIAAGTFPAQIVLGCGFHDTWTLSPRSFGHSFHAHLDRQSERSDAGLHC